MIKLDEKDIKQISNGRYFRKTNKRFTFLVCGSLGFLILIMFLVSEFKASIWFGLIPLIILLVGLIRWEKNRKKEEKSLVEEWKKEGIKQ